jgi:DNA-binding response OmpR family regulator
MLYSLEKDNIALRRKNEELEETLRQYTARIKSMTPHLPQLKLTRQQGRLLWSLYTAPQGFRSFEILGPFIRANTDLDSYSVSTVAFQVRRKVKAFGIKIENIMGQGYSMPKESRDIIKAMILAQESEI